MKIHRLIVRILTLSTLFLPTLLLAQAQEINIREPVSLSANVRSSFDLTPFYQQWIDVGGFPVVASEKVSPYAVKEAAFLIYQMTKHRPDILDILVESGIRFAVMAHNEMITDLPEYRNLRPSYYIDRRLRGLGGGVPVCGEENLLNYPGDNYSGSYNVLLHEFAHTVHLSGLKKIEPGFDDTLKMTYEAAIENGLWGGTYASTNMVEYWAEGAEAWFNPKTIGSFNRFGDTREELKAYDPRLATLLSEVFGDNDWRYTLPETRTHQPHLQGFDSQNTPTFQWPPDLVDLFRELRDPESTGNGKWVDLKPYPPNQLKRLKRLNASRPEGAPTEILFGNFGSANTLFVYLVQPSGELIPTDGALWQGNIVPVRTHVGALWLLKDENDKTLAVYRAEAKTGRVLILPEGGQSQADQVVSSEPIVLVGVENRPPMYWVDAKTGSLHLLVGAQVENLIPGIQNATSLAVDVSSGKFYWTEKMNETTSRIRRANLDGTNVQLVRDLTSVPHGIAIDTANGKLYLTNSWGKIQRLNLDGSKFQPNLITGLDNPEDITVDATDGKIYWTEKTSSRTGTIKSANFDGSNVQLLKDLTSVPRGIAVDTVNDKLYLTNSWGKIQRLNFDGSKFQPNFITGLDNPEDITVDATDGKIYWTEKTSIRRANLDTTNIQDIVTGLRTPINIVLGIPSAIDDMGTMASPSADINEDGRINVTDLLLVVTALQGSEPVNPRTDVNTDGTVTIADLLLVIQNLDDPVSASAPVNAEIITSLDQTTLETQLRLLIAESDGSLKYQRTITFLQILLATTRPYKTRLLANYPNPFNPETWIPYQLAKSAEVIVSIYSTDGMLVRRLALGHLPAGVYQSRNRAAYWDGKNGVGEPVASGVYFYTLETGDFTATRKMLTLK